MDKQTRIRKIANFLTTVHPCHPGDAPALIELRALEADGSITAGVFSDTHLAARYAVACDNHGANVFYSLNPLDPDSLHAQKAPRNRMDRNVKYTSRDLDMLHRDVYLIDIDPSRPSGVCATDAEKAGAWG